MTSAVPYVDLARQHAPLRAELLSAVDAVLAHGHFVQGPEVAAFEAAMAELCGVREAVAVNSGTDALVLALRVLGIGPGDEVITVPNSFVATASAIALVGATPVFVDVADDYTLDPALLQAALTERTRAIIPVHLTGCPADMAPILTLARERGLFVVEDCAQAIGARDHGRPVGGLGDLGCFSLHPLKTLNACGDGGVITLNDPDRAERLRDLRNLGLVGRGLSGTWSGHSRLDSIQAAILLVKLRYLQDWTARRRANAAFYRRALGDIEGLVPPIEPTDRTCVYHTFVVQADRRDRLKAHLENAGIGTAVHYPVPIHLQPCAAALGYRRGDFPRTEALAETILSLPIYPELEADQRQRVAESIGRFYKAQVRLDV